MVDGFFFALCMILLLFVSPHLANLVSVCFALCEHYFDSIKVRHQDRARDTAQA